MKAISTGCGKHAAPDAPLVPGQVFGAQAQEALIDHLLLSKTRTKHMTLLIL